MKALTTTYHSKFMVQVTVFYRQTDRQLKKDRQIDRQKLFNLLTANAFKFDIANFC